MTTTVRITAVLLLLGAACAGAGGTGGAGGGKRQSRYFQADQKMTSSQIEEEALRAKLDDAGNHASRAEQARESGNMDQARAEYGTAADIYRSALELFPTSYWRMPIAYRAAMTYFQAGQPERAAELGQKVWTDPEANEISKAMGSHLAAAAWQAAAVTAIKAGQLEPVKLATPEQRHGQPLQPRTPPGAWKRFVDAADAYAKNVDADPDAKKPAAERSVGLSPAQIALIAAEIEYSSDNMEDARGRFDRIIQRWTTEPNIVEDAVPLYLNTFLVLKDEEGYRTSLASLQKRFTDAAAEAEKAKDAERIAAVAKVREQLKRFEAGVGFDQASALLAQGKAAEAAERFEAIAAQNPGSPDAPLALYNASVAWNKAEKLDRANGAARAILEKYPDSKVAANATLALAASSSKKGDHKGAADLYGQYIARYPDAQNRCLALQNVGYELDVLGQKAQAAERYVGFATNPACAKEDPNAAAKALYRSGRLFLDAKQKAKAVQAFEAATQVQDVTDEVAKSQVAEAKRLAKKK